MEYKNIVKGKFISRPNRFIAEVEISGEPVRCHVKNTGRCRELLIPGADVYLEDFAGRMGSRRLRYSLIAVMKGNTLINMDSQAPNKVVAEALHSCTIQLPEMSELRVIKAEKTYGGSRLDFYVEDICGRKGFIEVKGVTLEEGGIAMFPDAPTERGVRHIDDLCNAVSEGFRAYIVFVIQMKGISLFTPNYRTHAAFGEALKKASACGVHILCCDCLVTPDSITAGTSVKLRL